MKKYMHLLIGPCFAILSWQAQATVFGPEPLKDFFVSRPGPERQESYSKGDLGIVLTSYRRSALYEAYRALAISRTSLQAEDQKPHTSGPASTVEEAAIPNWLRERQTIKPEAPRRELDLYRKIAADSLGSFINCTPGAFDLARQTLADLKARRELSSSEVRQWLDAQDQVFDLCTLDPKPGVTAVVPLPLPSSAKPLLRHLRQYQIAAAHFYASQYVQAINDFDAVVAIKDHPLRHWAALAAMRAVMRELTLDMRFERSYAATRNLPQSEKESVFRLAAGETLARENVAMAQLENRGTAIHSDTSLAIVHAATRKLLTNATYLVRPDRAISELGDQLNDLARNPYTDDTLDRWQQLTERVMDFGPRNSDVTQLRQRWAFFDWTRTIQACTTNRESPNYTGRCAQEHAYALGKFKHQPSPAWLLASLMTAERVDAQNQVALDAALRTTPDAIAYLSLQYHAARVLQSSGKLTEAAQIVDTLLARPGLDRSATHLLRQLRVASSANLQETLPYLTRASSDANRRVIPKLAADGDALLNHGLSVQSLIALGQQTANLSNQGAIFQRELIGAAWFRAELLGNAVAADQAARAASALSPSMRSALAPVLNASSAQERQDAVLLSASSYNLSPMAFWSDPQQLAQRRGAIAPTLWCSFSSSDLQPRLAIERVPASHIPVATDARQRDTELAQLHALGSGPQWFARQVFAFVKRNPTHPANTGLLRAVSVSAENYRCPHPQAEQIDAQAKAMLAALPTSAGVTEAQIRTEYDRLIAQMGSIEYDVRHILLSTETQAREALTLIQSGTPFESVARRMSLDSGSAPRGGSLGWSHPKNFVEPFAQAIVSLASQGLSNQPTRSVFGWHVIEVLGRRPTVIPSYEKMRESIKQSLELRQKR